MHPVDFTILYPDTQNSVLAERYGVSLSQIVEWARRIPIRKTKSFKIKQGRDARLLRKPEPLTFCTVDECNARHYSLGYCSKHYKRVIKYGEPDLPPSKTLQWILNNRDYRFDDCLKWPFCNNDVTKNNQVGRGVMRYKGHTRLAARVMCEIAHGLPPTLSHAAAHNCGNGHLGCCNPRHLRWATAKENSADMLIHGTANIGERCATAKMSEEKVRYIRSRAGQLKLSEIGQMFGITETTVHNIIHRKTWKHVD